MNWDQILLRKINNEPLNIEYYDSIGTSVIVGSKCRRPLVFNFPFLLDVTKEHMLIDELNPENGNKNINNCNFIIPYTFGLKKKHLLTENCILKLDGPALDLKLLNKINIGGFLVDLTKIYSSLMRYDDIKNYLNINSGIDLSIEESSGHKINLNLFQELGQPIGEWFFSLRRLFDEVPFGIRIPANYIERDIILAATWGIDFIIFDCTDTIYGEDMVNVVIPSISTLVRATKVISKLPDKDISLIIEEPYTPISNYLKIFALGGSIIMFSDLKKTNVANCRDKMQVTVSSAKDFCKFRNTVLHSLKQNIYQCGCDDIGAINKKMLLTNSTSVKSFTDIANVNDPDIISVPFYNLGRKRTTKK